MAEQLIRAHFFQRDPLACARELVGARLVWGGCSGTIVETEAYSSQNDEASHTFSRPSARAFIERNAAGAAYIYFSYGAHWMLNVLVKGKQDGFVLIRALEPKCGIKLMKKRRGVDAEQRLCSGPGKLTQALDITNRHHEMNLCTDPRHCFVRDAKRIFNIIADPRIGISRSAHHMWRFTLHGSPFVSRPPKRLPLRSAKGGAGPHNTPLTSHVD